MSNLALRDKVTAIIEKTVYAHQLFVKTLPNRYGDRDTIKRSLVLDDIGQLRRELLQDIDAVLVMEAH